MPLDNPPPIVSARPTVRIDGMELPLLSAAIERMRVREAIGLHASLELTLRDTLPRAGGGAGYGATSASPLRLGAAVKVYAGETATPREIFDGRITALEAEVGPHTTPLFTVLADDHLFAARKTRRSRTFEAASPADVLRAIAGEHGLTAEIRAGLDAPVTDWAQVNETDLAFLRRVLSAVDADAQVVGRVVQAGPIGRDARTTRELRFGRNLLRGRFTADLAEQAREARVNGFDPLTGEAVLGSADDAAFAAGALGPGSGGTGAAALAGMGVGVRVDIGHRGAMSAEEATLLARASYAARARRFLRADATAQGDASLRVGSHVRIQGVNPRFENTYAVVEATHRFDRESGYLTDFIGECAYLPGGT